MKQQTDEVRITLRVVRFPELHLKVGLCRSQIWRLEKKGRFPKSVPLGENSKGWIESEVDAWLNERRDVVA
ncbi:helix-turn-helix transcriptional regulator [Mariprofundus ferrooxydans]|uniref:helix-turn-helix transcriptional regulator n=1 Tax=Mariprofundus ferrooxydans TaxID=314344 RepID=UPI00143203D8|nr:AlpA family transcriptional regulator [Mariprofundus ferrooxydans]